MNSNALPKNLSAFIWYFLKSYKTALVIFISMALLAGCWGPFNSLLIKNLINTLVANQASTSSKVILIAWLLVLNFLIFDNLTWRTISYLNYKFEPLIKNKIISQSFNYTLGSSHQFFQDNLSGRLANQITTLADNIERILHRISADFFRGISLLIIALISMYHVDARFFYTLLIWFISFSSISLFLSKYLIALSDQHAESRARRLLD